MRLLLLSAFACCVALAGFAQEAAAAPRVVVSIKPLHSLVSGVMEGLGEPVLLVTGAASPHHFQLKPSQARRLREADIVFYMGHDYERFLEQPLRSFPPKVAAVAMETQPGMHVYPLRAGHHHEEEHGEEEHEGGNDLHLWLDPKNAIAMVSAIERVLTAADPDRMEKYHENARRLTDSLRALDSELRRELMPVRNKPYIVFHDAYQYFEKAYGLRGAGSISPGAEQAPGPQRLRDIREKVESGEVACVFREPNFPKERMKTLLAGTPARSLTLDPEGLAHSPGPALYAELMKAIARNMVECLE